MKFYVLKNGILQRTGDCPDDHLAVQAGAGEEVFEGDPPPDTLPPPPPPPSLDELKADKWREIKSRGNAAALGGFTAGTFTWDSDLATQQAMQRTWQDMKEADGPTSVQWYTSEGAAVTLTPVQFRNLCRALRNHLETQRSKAATLRAQIAAATTQAELDAIVW